MCIGHSSQRWVGDYGQKKQLRSLTNSTTRHLCRLVCRLKDGCHAVSHASVLWLVVSNCTQRQLCPIGPPTRTLGLILSYELWIYWLILVYEVTMMATFTQESRWLVYRIQTSIILVNYIFCLFSCIFNWLWSTVEKPPRTRRSERSTFVVELCQLILLTVLLWLDSDRHRNTSTEPREDFNMSLLFHLAAEAAASVVHNRAISRKQLSLKYCHQTQHDSSGLKSHL